MWKATADGGWPEGRPLGQDLVRINLEVTRAMYPSIVMGRPSEIEVGQSRLAKSSVRACINCAVRPVCQADASRVDKSLNMVSVRHWSSSACQPSTPTALWDLRRWMDALRSFGLSCSMANMG